MYFQVLYTTSLFQQQILLRFQIHLAPYIRYNEKYALSACKVFQNETVIYLKFSICCYCLIVTARNNPRVNNEFEVLKAVII
jgi:hypothetical protein